MAKIKRHSRWYLFQLFMGNEIIYQQDFFTFSEFFEEVSNPEKISKKVKNI